MQPIDYWVTRIDASHMHSFVITAKSWEFKIYKDWVLEFSTTSTSTWTPAPYCIIWCWWSSDQSRNMDWYIRQVVVDSSIWTADDVLAYHNWTSL